MFSSYKFRIFCYVLTLQFIIVINTHGQNYVDLVKLNASTTPLNTFDSSRSQSVLNEYGADLSLPIKLNEKTAFLTGAIYENINTKLFPDEAMQSLSGITLKLGVNHNFNEHFSTTMVLLPKLATNFGTLTQKDMQLGGIALFKYAVNKNLNYRYGLYYNAERFGPFFVPLLGVYYLSNNTRFELNVMLPLSADMNYRLIKFMSIGANFFGQTRSYHVSNISPGLKSSYVVRVTNELYGYLKFTLPKNIILLTKCGYSLGRKYRVYHDDDKTDLAFPLTYINDHRRQLNKTFSDGLLFQAVLIYRLPLK
ncbi:MAG: hypothetical protein H7141_05945 [Burkholderiales bacterium]|nr:hypothetical protein [Bacteroidia bacterium]